ncbi:hypothetical protein BDQ17DRAFT_1330356 [Cyathus striatus]|nr:hypothetical protein BDQ17DRAFT_1330356 [Cyathus striatus]
MTLEEVPEILGDLPDAEITKFSTYYTKEGDPVISYHPFTKPNYPASSFVYTRIPALHLDEATECLIAGPLKRKIYNTPRFPTLPIFNDAPYEIKGAEAMGLGVFATRDIYPGELILIDRPLLTIPEQVPLGYCEKVLQFMLGRMTEVNRKAFMQLSNVHLYNENVEGPLSGIFLTNAFTASEHNHEGRNQTYTHCAVMKKNIPCQP